MTGGWFMLGAMMDGAPVKLDGRVIGQVRDGAVVVTDDYAARMLNAGSRLDVSVAPVDAVPARSSWPRSPDCRDSNCSKCDGSAWDLAADQVTHCMCDCHPTE